MKILIYLLTIFLCISVFNCYTVIEKRAQERSNIYLNHELVGSWIYINTRIDRIPQIKSLHFYPDGEASFYPFSESGNGHHYSAKFKIINDTLEVQILNNLFKEVFTYKIENSILTLEKIDTGNKVRTPIAKRSEETWEKKK